MLVTVRCRWMILSYVELNTNLLECFGGLENLCNQIYGPTHGVTNYIEEMKSKDFNGRVIVPNWDYYLNRLKEVRHKRNRLSHGEVSFREQFATVDDVRFVIDFRNRILNQIDPLTLYYKHTRQFNMQPQQRPFVNNQIQQQIKYPQPYYSQPVYQNHNPKNQPPQRKSMGCFTAVLIVVAVVTGLISFFI